METIGDVQLGNLTELIVRFGFNALMAGTILIFVYRRFSENKEFTFTLFIFNFIIFALCTILNNVELSIGSGFGLFAIFTMMRYRSEQLNIKDMTYLLVMVGLGFVNSTFKGDIGPAEVVFMNLAIGVSLYVFERTIFTHNLRKQKIKYDKLELLKPRYTNLLKKDLSLRLGKEVTTIKIESVNFLEGYACLQVMYENNHHLAIEHVEEMVQLHEQEVNNVLEGEKQKVVRIG
jgi:hypothetical protein